MAEYFIASGGDDGAAGDIDHPWAGFYKANTTLASGDTVYVRAGTYNVTAVSLGNTLGEGVNPANSGSSGNLITYSGYQDEVVTVVGAVASCRAVDLDSDSGTVRSYIKVTKLIFSGFYKHLWILKGTHCEISYCSFIGVYGATREWRGSTLYRNAQYNHIHHCVFGDYGSFEDNDDDAVILEIGNESAADDDTSYNLIEENHIYHGGHHVMGCAGNHNVIRNNYVHNEAWWPIGTPTYGNRILFFDGPSSGGLADRNLLEGNRIAFGDDTSELDQVGGSGMTLASSYNIIRKNQFYKTKLHAIRMNIYSGMLCTYNRIYGNTFWQCGVNEWPNGYKNAYSTALSHAIHMRPDSGAENYVHNNAIKNNLFWQNANLTDEDNPIYASAPVIAANTFGDNSDDNTTDPLFADITSALDEDSDALPDLRPTTGSPAIDNGGFLTTITSEDGTDTSFVVADAGYFMDGWGIVDGDEIQLEGQASSVTVTSVDYDTNTITVDAALTWTQGDGVALAFTGTAPDQGYYEQPAAAGTLAVIYSGNGATSGTPPDGGSTHSELDTITVLGNTGALAKTGYYFRGWNTAADGSGTRRAPGATFEMPAENETLYAEWGHQHAFKA